MNVLACPACGTGLDESQKTYFIRTGRGRNLWANCKACSGYFLAQEYSLAEEVDHTRTMAWGNEDLGLFLNEFKNKMFSAVLALLSKYAPPPASLLDVGCSYGGFLIEAQKAGYQVAGTDIVQEAVTYLQEHGILAEVSSTLAEPFQAHHSSWDIISVLDCNCYWPDQVSELKYAHAKLKRGGLLVMRVVGKSWMFSLGLRIRKIHPRLGERIVWKAVNDHRFSMPFKSLLRLIEGLGFEIIYAAPKGALHSERSSLPVKLAFSVGQVIWKSLKRSCAPGALLIAKKVK